MHQVLLDTNIIILHVSKQHVIAPASIIPTISTLTVFELLQYSKLTTVEEQAIRSIVNDCIIEPVSIEIAQRAAVLGRKYCIGPIDLLLAATALELDVPFITKNSKDFRKIPGLVIQESI